MMVPKSPFAWPGVRVDGAKRGASRDTNIRLEGVRLALLNVVLFLALFVSNLRRGVSFAWIDAVFVIFAPKWILVVHRVR